MKYAITGHTSNIGYALFKKLSPNAVGFSKSTGYDITKKEDRKSIINESVDCDVFINNAYDGFGQADLCLELWNEWKDLPKTIINIGSRIAEDHIVLNKEESYLLKYSMHKRTLKKLSLDLAKIDTNVKVKYKWFGYVGTPKILKKYPYFTEKDYISIDKAVEIILNN